MRGLSALGSAALLLASCSVYDTSLKAHGAGGATSAGGSGASGDGASAGIGGNAAGGSGGQAGAPTCMLKSVPPRPAGHNLSSNINREIVAVQSDIDLGDSPPGPMANRYLSIGYDLDKLCTLTPLQAMTETQCTLPKGSVGVLDGPMGQDNAMGYIIQQVRNFVPDTFSSAIYTQQLMKGAANAIIHVTHYNGLADDDQVRVEALVSANYYAFGGDASTPRWDGNDIWPVASDSVNNNDLNQPKNVDNNAYVNQNELVATLGDSGFRLYIGLTTAVTVNLNLHLHGAFVTCKITPTDAGRWGFTLTECTLAGRWTADDLLHQIWRFPDPTDLQHPKPLCTDSGPYHTFKNYICMSQDITSSFTAGPTEPCDALSFGVNFNTGPALLGDVFGVQDMATTCLPNVSPENDSCEADGGTPIITGNGGTSTGAAGAAGSAGAAGAAGNGGSAGAGGSGGAAGNAGRGGNAGG
jgi:hypothetical protein